MQRYNRLSRAVQVDYGGNITCDADDPDNLFERQVVGASGAFNFLFCRSVLVVNVILGNH
jgi:hypothetical protein